MLKALELKLRQKLHFMEKSRPHWTTVSLFRIYSFINSIYRKIGRLVLSNRYTFSLTVGFVAPFCIISSLPDHSSYWVFEVNSVFLLILLGMGFMFFSTILSHLSYIDQRRRSADI